MRATLNEPIPLQALIADGNTALFVKATVLNADQATVATVYPVHVQKGLYSATWTPTTEGFYAVIFEFFLDPAFTEPAGYDAGGEQVEVTSDKTNILRLLALNHENAVLDQQVYDSGRRLLSARLRGYDSRLTAAAGGENGLLFAWTITSTYDASGRATLFKIDRYL